MALRGVTTSLVAAVSLKYQRVKQADLVLPAPLRWLTRAFSSITLAVTLLSLVAFYGVLGSVPAAFLARGLLCGGAIVGVMLLAIALAAGLSRGQGGFWKAAGWLLGTGAVGLVTFTGAAVLATLAASAFIDRGWPAPLAQGLRWAALATVALGQALLIYRFTRSRMARAGPVRPALAAALLAAGWAHSILAARAILDATAYGEWFVRHKATIIYRLPHLEMTELEFFSWWPFKIVLSLFVINLIWATIRRIEFKFVNVGVLTVHTGIILVALGSICYGQFKVEGDTILWRKDLGGQPVSRFYDVTQPAIYFTVGHKNLQVALPNLPRYNDYPIGGTHGLNIALHDHEHFREVFGSSLRANIKGFLAYAELQPVWVDATAAGDPTAPLNPAIRLALGDREGALGDFSQVLVAGAPAQRVLDQPGWALEYLGGDSAPGPQRLADLMAEFRGEHGLVVEVPAAGLREVYSIAPGDRIEVGETDYQLEIEAVGPYGMSIVTRGFEGAEDTRAAVLVTRPDGRSFRRIAMHRYPELAQDFTPAPEDPSAGPMGRRGPPSGEIHLAYLDASKLQLRLIEGAEVGEPAARDGGGLRIMARIPGQPPFFTALPSAQGAVIPIGRSPEGREAWLHVSERLARAVRVWEPAITPRTKRNPKDEGTYVHGLVGLELSLDLPAAADGGTTTWRRTVWLPHLRYPNLPTPDRRPAVVQVPTLGAVQIAFSRVSYELPFALEMVDFQMQAYPGSEIPRDFLCTLNVYDASGGGAARVTPAQARLNNPLIYRADGGPWILRKLKISQTGWDPGDRQDPGHAARDAEGRFLNQQRFTILGVGNNVGIRVVALGLVMIGLGIPWAFYVKPLLVQRQKRRLQQQHAARAERPRERASPVASPSGQALG